MSAFDDFQSAFGGGAPAAPPVAALAPASDAQADFEAAFANGAPAHLPPPSVGAVAKDVAKQAGSVAVEAPVMLTAGAPGDIDQFTQPGGAFDTAFLGVAHRLADWSGYGPQKGTPERAKFDKAYLDAERYISGLDPLSGRLPTTQGILGAAGIQLPEPQTTAGRYTRTVGDFAAGAALGAGPAALARGMESGLVPAVKSVARGAASGVAPGVGTQALTDTANATGNADLAPLAQFAGGPLTHAATGTTAAAVGRLARTDPIAGVLDKVGISGPSQARATDRFMRTASDPEGVRQALNSPINPEGEEGTKFASISAPGADGTPIFAQPTTPELTQDPGLMNAQRGVMAKRPDEFLPQMARANEARIAYMQSDPEAAPLDVANHLRDGLDAIHDDANAKVDQARAAGEANLQQTDQSTQAALDAARGGQAAAEPIQSVAPELLGERMRQPLASLNAEAKAREGELHEAIDPKNTLTASTSPIADAVDQAYGSLSRTAQGFVSAPERQFIDLIQSYKPTESYREVADLNSSLSAAMRVERATNQGATPALRRMSLVMNGVKTALSDTVRERQAAEAQAVADGHMSPEETMEAQVRALQQKWATDYGSTRAYAGNELAGTGTGTGRAYEGRAFSVSGPSGTTGASARQSVRPPNDQGISSEASFGPVSDEAASRIRAANQATRERKATFERGAVGQVLRSGPVAGDYRLADSAVPAKLFQPGPSGYDAVRGYFNAVGDHPEATNAMHAAATNELAKRVEANDGVLTETQLRFYRRRFDGALRAIDERTPGFSRRFDDAAIATTAVERLIGARRDALKQAEEARDASVKDAEVQGKQAAKDYQQGIVKSLLASADDGSVVAHLKGLLKKPTTGVQEADRLASAVRGNDDAEAALRNATSRAFSESILGKQKILGSDTPRIAAGVRQRFNAAEPMLRKLLPDAHVDVIRKAVIDAERAETAFSGSRIPGGSNTAQDTAAIAAHGGGHKAMTIGQAALLEFVGEHAMPLLKKIPGAALTLGVGGFAVRAMRNMGVSSQQRYFEEMLRNPEFAAQMVKRISATNDVRQQRITGLIRKALMRGHGPNDKDDGGVPPNQPPPTGPFSRSGTAFEKDGSRRIEGRTERPNASGADTSSTPPASDNVAHASADANFPQPNVPLTGRQARTLRSAGYEPDDIRAMTPQERAAALRKAEAAGHVPSGRITAADRAAMGGALPHVAFGNRTGDGRFSGRGDILAHPDINGRIEPTWHPDADRVHQEILAHEKRLDGRQPLAPDASIKDVRKTTDTAAGDVLAMARKAPAPNQTALGDLAKTDEPRLSVDTSLGGKRRMTARQVEREIQEREAQARDLRQAGETGRAENIDGEVRSLRSALPAFEGYKPGDRAKPFTPAKIIDAGDQHVVSIATDQRHGADAADKVFRIFDKPAGGAERRADLGRQLGQVDISRGNDGRWEVKMVEVSPRARGKGVATALYNAVQKELGVEMSPSGILLPDGHAFWQKRAPEKVQWHQKVETPQGNTYYFSPKRLGMYAEAGRGPGDADYRKMYDALPPEAKSQAALDAMFSLRQRGAGEASSGEGQASLSLHNDRSGASAAAQSVAPLSDMLSRFDASRMPGTANMSKVNSLAVGSRLSKIVGDMPVYTVGPQEMRTLAEGRVKMAAGKEPAGFYDPQSKHIVLLDDALRNPQEATQLVLHEGLHGALMNVITDSRAARSVLDHLRDTAASAHVARGGAEGDHYGLTNAHEFVSEAFSNPDFQRFLSSIPADNRLIRAFGLQNTGRTMWDAFVSAVRKILGVPHEQHSLLDAAMKVGGKLFDMAETRGSAPAPAPAPRSPAVPPGIPMPPFGAMRGRPDMVPPASGHPLDALFRGLPPDMPSIGAMQARPRVLSQLATLLGG